MTWGIIQSAVAAVLLISGGLEVLQTASIAAAFPFAIIMIFMCYSLLKGLQSELEIQPRSKSHRTVVRKTTPSSFKNI
jgi:glycine betaine transporter